MNSKIPKVWLDWIRKGLDQGSAPHALLSVMIKEGLDPESSEAAIAGSLKQSALTNHKIDSFLYEHSLIQAGNNIVVSDKTLSVAFRLEQPDVILINNFLSDLECEALILEASARITPSTVVDLKNGGRILHEGRTSEGMCFKRGENELIARIDLRIAELLNLPIEHGEGIQILHYQEGAEYRPHYDYFPEDSLGSKEFLDQGGQRIATLVMYLNDVDEGGETVFPEIKLSVAPQRGSVLYFSYSNSLNQLDQKTLHGGAPVIRGDKWIATKWIRRNIYFKQ